MDFDDKQAIRYLGSSLLSRSPLLERLWPYGHSSVGRLTFESAAYVARYVMKKITGDLADTHYQVVDESTGEITNLVPEFCHMSLKPGIGATWLEKYYSDVYPNGLCVSRGVEALPPRYYDKLNKRRSRLDHDELVAQREASAAARYADNTVDRLRVREQVAAARVALNKRRL